MSEGVEAADAPLTFWHVEEEGSAEHAHAHAGGGTLIGFWIYLMSDALLFATIFATFGVLSSSFAGGPTPKELFDLGLVALNTGLLLMSALTCGLAMIALQAGRLAQVRLWLVVTALLGIGFVGIELHEFADLIAEGATPMRSSYLSAFFTLVGTHGLHVSMGVLWIGVMLVQLGQRGLHPENRQRLLCLSMYWHFLDVVWIGVFTFVYLLGVLR
ncbi:MAG: cytochrome o ubiquinol oxidase subunit III [Proteobacteria bacterium]|nr:MAG: cytochrome o ubiquinol oxidase subunit III [Pseudomonadota bacterium]